MAGKDELFARVYRWLDGAVDAISIDPTTEAVAAALRTRLGLQLGQAQPPDPQTLVGSSAAPQSLALAALVTGEALSTLHLITDVVQHLEAGQPALGDVTKVIAQLRRILDADVASKPPTAYSIGKLLLLASGDADQISQAEPALRLARMLRGTKPGDTSNASADRSAQKIAGLTVIIVGALIDRTFADTSLANTAASVADSSLTSVGTLDSPSGLSVAMALENDQLTVKLTGGVEAESGELDITLSAKNATLVIPLLGSAQTRPTLADGYEVQLAFTRKAPLVLGDAAKTHLSIGKIKGVLGLKSGDPRLELDLADVKLSLDVDDDAFLGAILGPKIELGLQLGLVCDSKGGLRLKDGTGLRATLPVDRIPGSPVQITHVHVEVTADSALNDINVEISGAFKVKIGPFAGSIDRLGTKLGLGKLTAAPHASWGLAAPKGAGLSLDAGVVRGGGYLLFDEPRGEYGGVIDVKLAGIGVKAVAILSTKNPGGWSLLLIITAQLPHIQLGFGFTLTGVGGLIGVQHTVSVDELQRSLATGALDSFLFPQNPVENAPQIINQLRSVFPFKSGGFVIGPMLELGWGTPSLVTARAGLLVEESQIVFVGQVIVQMPPRVDKGLCLLYLQVDFAGGIAFDPFQVWFNGVLRDSRVAFVSLTGQFLFRARFGDRPSFLLSAGGFHPRFTDVPSDVPSPLERVGAEMSIGIVGMSFKGYFAVTAATVQTGASMRAWVDVGIASVEGGFEFNAILYFQPTFHFECDIRWHSTVEVFGLDFAGFDICGLFAGPGRWRIAGRATLKTPWPLPDFHFGIDASWGEERTTERGRRVLADVLKEELAQVSNWTAQLPSKRTSYATFATPSDGDASSMLTHPGASLQFRQKRLPLGKKLDKLGTDAIEGAASVVVTGVSFGGQTRAPDRALKDPFAAAQFLEVTEEEALASPSFDPFQSGFQLAQDTYDVGPAATDTFEYEERNLSSEGSSGLLAGIAFTNPLHVEWALHSSAAGRSPLRVPDWTKPPKPLGITVAPAAFALVDVDAGVLSGQASSGLAAESFWHAQESARAAGARTLQVVEIFETLV